MAISGHTSVQTVINSTANANPYTGSFTVGGTSDLVVLFVSGWTGTTADPATWTVTLDGSAISFADSSFGGVSFGAATYELTGLSAGSHTLSVSYSGAGRACQAIAFVISGHDGTTPVAARGYSSSYNLDVATLSAAPTTTRDGNVLVSMVSNREAVTTTEYSLSGGTLIGAQQTGANASSDITSAYGYHEVATAGSVTDTYTWTNTGRCHLAWVEINVATGGGGDVTGTLAGTETGADTFTASGSVAISGALAAADAGADTAAITGAVAVTGTLAATEAGADTFAATGTVSAAGIAGVLAATETGSDAFAGAGAVVVSGVLAASEVGVDVLAATGAVAVSGALVALEIGADVFSGSGSGIDMPVTGTMAAVEIGADVFFGASDISLRRIAHAYESANGGRVIPQANGGSFRPTRTGGTFAATANGGKLLG